MITVQVIAYNNKHVLSAEPGIPLTSLLDREHIPYTLFCGGGAICGRCKVKFLDGAPRINSHDEARMSKEELQAGYRLLCKCILDQDCAVELGNTSADPHMNILTMDRQGIGDNEGAGPENLRSMENGPGAAVSPAKYGVAVDLGTTTIAAVLIKLLPESSYAFGKKDVEPYEVIQTASCINRQRKYGADVISRIAAAEDPASAEDMRQLIIEDIEKLITEDLLSVFPDEACLSAVTIAGNTTMLHLLRGYDVSGLGKYPYTPYSIDMEKTDSAEIFDNIRNVPVVLFPGVSAFVGADIVAGLYSLESKLSEKCFFLDLGTNGEMAYYDGKSLKVTSAAAGPVFEAGGISCGTASVPGAICHVMIDENTHRPRIQTIGDAAPTGICGSGVLEATSELVRCGIIDATGLLADKFFDEGFPLTEDNTIRFTQQDIRNVQLAKAAILTGIKMLLGGAVPDRIYIAGGFGSSLNTEKIEKLRMFPEGFGGKIVAAGNTALKGATLYTAAVLSGAGAEEKAAARLKQIRETAQAVELSAIDSFDETYLEAMNF